MKSNQAIVMILIVAFFSVIMLITMVKVFNGNQEATKDMGDRINAGKELQIKIDSLVEQNQ